ncbi:xanthine dehydrogenase family protein molybdopterin-binding subunit [Sphingomonas faeni]|uniref:xanthine dehydrogenase family protein molybdopterin-binding subunit n=1 Tax=Sphingomonas faeni TaxID=185950 RepID=UPI002787991C|nr:molybdopterin cofactor-binding domain-containing protein [Sphingomonas faeni]MDQ0839336.1 nicotinate dehydrogenase subunit B [Sphingomonas faeni]
MSTPLSRRQLLGAGSLVVAFSMMPQSLAQLAGGGEGGAGPKVVAPDLPGSLKSYPELESWIRIDARGRATVFTGKAELGQGIATALWQVAAEELDLPPSHVELITADTSQTPDEGLTAGSHSMQDSGTAIANAAANVRMLLTRNAAERWGLPASDLTTDGNGNVVSADGRRIGYGALAAALDLHVRAIEGVPRRDPASYRTMAHDVPRRDIPAKVTGGQSYVQDLRMPGMLHARVVRGPSFGTVLQEADFTAAARLPGVVRIVRNGRFAAVVALTEWQAIAALRRLQQSPWIRTAPPLPSTSVAATLKALPSRDITVLDTGGPAGPTAPGGLSASYSRPWLSHGSIGPSCSVALYDRGTMTIWSHSQGVFDVHRAVAQLVGLPPEKVRCIHTQGSGCYGQNGADDASADVAVIAKEMPGVPIRLQWMREQEFGWEPLGPGMATELAAQLGPDGKIAQWRHVVWSNPHNNRPVDAGGYLAGQEVANPFPAPIGKPIPMPEGDGDRNSNPLYALPNMHVLYHFLPDMPLRVSALRSLGAHLNVFSIESMFDELARSSGQDPLAFRLNHMEDPRARAVMIEATRRFRWDSRPRGDGRRGCGMAFARYKNLGAYCAIAMEVEVERETGVVSVRRVIAAVDAGQPASPDGIRNQVEGGIVQSLSWTTREAVEFDTSGRTSFDWSGYPISRFSDVPDDVQVHVLPQAGMPFLGAGETAQGPTAAAFANAIADATGIRMRDMPLTPDKLRAAIGPI